MRRIVKATRCIIAGMRTLVVVIVAALFATAVADGEELLGGPRPGVYSSHAHDARDDLLICRSMAALGLGADYVAGVDATGRPVPPADLGGSSATSWQPVVAFDVPVPKGLMPPAFRDTSVGTVEVDTRTGQVAIDGVALNPSQYDHLRRICATR